MFALSGGWSRFWMRLFPVKRPLAEASDKISKPPLILSPNGSAAGLKAVGPPG